MAYSTKKLFDKAVKEGKAKKFVFFDDYVCSLGISCSTFYEHFPKESKKYSELEAILHENRAVLKNGIRKKWYECDNPNAWKYLYLLIGNQDERHALHGSKTENDTRLSGGISLVVGEDTKATIDGILSSEK
jgi:hypothetical protein